MSRKRPQSSSNVPKTPTRTPPRPGKPTLIGYHSSSGVTEAPGERKGMRAARVDSVLKTRIPQPKRAPRGQATHTLYGSRGSDVSVILKETFDLRKRAGEVKVRQRDRGLRQLESKHLHGGVGLDGHLTPARPRRSTSSAASRSPQLHVSLGKLGPSQVAVVQGIA